jgi:hypothetical protein
MLGGLSGLVALDASQTLPELLNMLRADRPDYPVRFPIPERG